jgi:hypothetical protein
VRDGVGVGVAGQAGIMRDALATEDERTAGGKAVGVVPDPDPGHARGG